MENEEKKTRRVVPNKFFIVFDLDENGKPKSHSVVTSQDTMFEYLQDPTFMTKHVFVTINKEDLFV